VDDERLRQQVVLAVDALPVPPAPRHREWRGAHRVGIGGFSLARLAIATVATALLVFVIAPLVLTSGGPAAPQTKQSTYADDFSVGVNRARWNTWGSDGTMVTASEGRVELAIPAGAKPKDGYISAVLYARCVGRGDYDVSFEYTLLDWPAANGTQIEIAEFAPGNATVSRNQGSGYESYGAFDGPNSGSTQTADTSGSLRLVRKGTKVVGLHRSSTRGEWVELPVQMTSQFDATFQIFLFAGEREFGGQPARVAVDNFVLRGDQVICPTQ
jgi:hypothetical protein